MNYNMPKVDKNLLIRHTFEFLSDHELTLTIRVSKHQLSEVTVTMDHNNTHVRVYMSGQEYAEMLSDFMSFHRMLFVMYGKLCRKESKRGNYDKLEE